MRLRDILKFSQTSSQVSVAGNEWYTHSGSCFVSLNTKWLEEKVQSWYCGSVMNKLTIVEWQSLWHSWSMLSFKVCTGTHTTATTVPFSLASPSYMGWMLILFELPNWPHRPYERSNRPPDPPLQTQLTTCPPTSNPADHMPPTSSLTDHMTPTSSPTDHPNSTPNKTETQLIQW